MSPLAATRKACEPDVMDTENLYLNLLQSAATWSLDGATLTITATDGGVLGACDFVGSERSLAFARLPPRTV